MAKTLEQGKIHFSLGKRIGKKNDEDEIDSLK
jgi:hypothetical protein